MFARATALAHTIHADASAGSLCEPVSCGVYPPVVNGSVSTGGSMVHFGEYATITCSPGFIFSDGGLGSVPCTSGL